MSTTAQTAKGLPDDIAYQEAILRDVSRTFALTIPRLPQKLRDVVGNAYLLCRIADTIEDSDSLTLEQKRHFYERFVAAATGEGDSEAFGCELAPLLAGRTLPAERDLARNTPCVIRVTHSFPPREQAALARCLTIMSKGMEEFQEGVFQHGLRDLPHLDAYCYHVAGVVGEMLTELFCAYSPDIEARRASLEQLAGSFGQGLQMTNILKDLWDDKERNVCWLPQDVFDAYDLKDLSPATSGDRGFEAGLAYLIGTARGHLENALKYTLLLPKSEQGIREFCLWALGMAVLTLRKINRNRAFTSGAQVKISRRAVKATIVVTRLCGFSNRLLRLVFRVAACGLPRPAEMR